MLWWRRFILVSWSATASTLIFRIFCVTIGTIASARSIWIFFADCFINDTITSQTAARFLLFRFLLFFFLLWVRVFRRFLLPLVVIIVGTSFCRRSFCRVVRLGVFPTGITRMTHFHFFSMELHFSHFCRYLWDRSFNFLYVLLKLLCSFLQSFI